jgi:hypothetical protein
MVLEQSHHLRDLGVIVDRNAEDRIAGLQVTFVRGMILVCAWPDAVIIIISKQPGPEPPAFVSRGYVAFTPCRCRICSYILPTGVTPNGCWGDACVFEGPLGFTGVLMGREYRDDVFSHSVLPGGRMALAIALRGKALRTVALLQVWKKAGMYWKNGKSKEMKPFVKLFCQYICQGWWALVQLLSSRFGLPARNITNQFWQQVRTFPPSLISREKGKRPSTQVILTAG